MTELQFTATSAYAAYKVCKPTFHGHEMELFFLSAGLWNMLISIGWTSLIKHETSATPTFIATLGVCYGLTGIFPEKMKYLIPLYVLGKMAVLYLWIKVGRPHDELKVLAMGDQAFAMVMTIAFYGLVLPEKKQND